MAGFFPPMGSQVWNENLSWQPIPVHTEPQDQDYLLAAGKQCDHFDYQMIQYLNTTAYTELFEKYRSLIRYMEINSGTTLSTYTDISTFYDVLMVEKLKGFWYGNKPLLIRIYFPPEFINISEKIHSLPPWAEQVMEIGGDLEYLYLNWFPMWTATPEMKKFRSGYLLKEILDHFGDKVQSKLSPDRSLWMYFAHDITLVSMLNTLGLYEVMVFLIN